MSAIDNLTAAVLGLTAAVDAAVTALETRPSEASVQAAADAVTAQTVRLQNAVNPTPPPAG